MAVELRNIPDRPGQVGADEHGRIVSGGLAAQAERALANVGLALDAAGASVGDLVKLTVYVVDWDSSKLEELGAGLLAGREGRPWTQVPMSVIGVQSLFEPEMLVELEGVAVMRAA